MVCHFIVSHKSCQPGVGVGGGVNIGFHLGISDVNDFKAMLFEDVPECVLTGFQNFRKLAVFKMYGNFIVLDIQYRKLF